ncbi:MAG: hypothetical protein RL093_387 [Pseudomonadota bacterium]
MRTLAVLVLATLTLAGAGPVVSQTPTMDQALRRARDATPLPLSLARDQADWRASHAELPEGMDPEADIQSRIEELTLQAERDARLGAMVFREPPALGRDCVATGLKGCSSPMGGYLALRDGGLQWQLQEGFTDEDGISGGIVFIGDAGGARMGPTAPIAWSFDSARFDAPVLLTGPEFGSAAYIAVPGIHAGSGGGNADVLFRWDFPNNRRLTQIDTWSWRDDLAERLPEGLQVVQGVRFDWPNMMAFTPLWQDGDGNCCGTGGTAILSFEIEGERLVLSNITVRDAVLEGAVRTPTEVYDYASRRLGCDHFGGEEGYDVERRAQIAAAVAELRCDALDAEAAALKRRHADNPRLLALIARAGAGGD